MICYINQNNFVSLVGLVPTIGELSQKYFDLCNISFYFTPKIQVPNKIKEQIAATC